MTVTSTNTFNVTFFIDTGVVTLTISLCLLIQSIRLFDRCVIMHDRPYRLNHANWIIRLKNISTHIHTYGAMGNGIVSQG